jgi:hypothetical protein
MVAEEHESVGSLKAKAEAQGLRTHGKHLLFDWEYLEDERSVGEYRFPPNASLWLVGAIGGLPPSGCCCFGTVYDGVRFFTRLFIAAQVVGMLATALAVVLTLVVSCPGGRCPAATAARAQPLELDPQSEQVAFARFVGGLIAASLLFAWNLLEFLVGLYGLKRLNRRDAVGVKWYGFMQAVLIGLSALFSFGVLVPLYLWYLYAIKVLYDQLKREQPRAGSAGAAQPPPPYSSSRQHANDPAQPQSGLAVAAV